MFRNYLVAALRNLARNRLYAAINIIGLAVGFTTAILIALFVRDELSYDSFIAGADDIYNIFTVFDYPGRAPLVADTATAASEFAGALSPGFADIESVARLAPDQQRLKRGDIEANERIYWADPTVFAVLPFPAIAGDLKAALATPDGIVLTRRMARKYFGSENVVGQIIDLGLTHPMRVTAVLDDFPSSTNFTAEIFASGKAEFSTFSLAARRKADPGGRQQIVHIFVRLKPGSAITDVQRGMPAFVAAHMQQDPPRKISFEFVALKDVHLHASELPALKPPGDKVAAFGIGAVGIFVLLIAGINFVNLATARAARRALEVGVRKSVGGNRTNLFVQFVCEGALCVLLGLVVAVSAAELLLPVMNTLLQRQIVFSYWRNPEFTGMLAAGGICVAVMAGLYPALILSSFRPLVVLRGGALALRGRSPRRVLVLTQFAILIGLLVSGSVIVRQMQFALGDALGVDVEQAVGIMGADCGSALKNRIENLPGVRGAACSSFLALNLGQMEPEMTAPDGTKADINSAPAGANFLAFYGVKPLAGRLLSDGRDQDLASSASASLATRSLVLNQRAVQRLGFSSAQTAIGQTVRWNVPGSANGAFTIVGVVPDFTFKTDLTRLFWTKRFDRTCLGKELGHAEEAVQRGADRYGASPD